MVANAIKPMSVLTSLPFWSGQTADPHEAARLAATSWQERFSLQHPLNSISCLPLLQEYWQGLFQQRQ
jgi:hypothetical protein